MRAKHPKYISIKDSEDGFLEYTIEIDGMVQKEVTYKSPKNGTAELDAEQKKKFLTQTSDILSPTSFFIWLEGGIGDIVYTLQTLLQIKLSLNNEKIDNEFIFIMPQRLINLFQTFLITTELSNQIISVEDYGNKVEISYKFKPFIITGSPNPLRADQFYTSKVQEFLLRRWNIPTLNKVSMERSINKYINHCTEKHTHFIKSHNLLEKGFIILSPSGSNEKILKLKSWPEQNWTDVINEILTQTDIKIVLCDNYEIYKTFEKNGRVVFFDTKEHQKDGIELFTVLIAHSFTGICIESGPAHLFNLLNKKALVLWGPTSPLIYSHDLHQNLRLSTCPPCSSSKRIQFCAENICMKDIPVNIVTNLALENIKENSND